LPPRVVKEALGSGRGDAQDGLMALAWGVGLECWPS